VDERPVLRQAPSVDAFLEAAGPFLLAREAEHCLTLGICGDLQAHPDTSAEAPYFGLVTTGSTVVLTVVWTPPWQLVLSTCGDPAAIPLVVDEMADREPIGANGPSHVADAFADAWKARTGQRARVLMRERIFRLSSVTRPHGVPGALRHAPAVRPRPPHRLADRLRGGDLWRAAAPRPGRDGRSQPGR
jgi:hypothetical protein